MRRRTIPRYSSQCEYDELDLLPDVPDVAVAFNQQKFVGDCHVVSSGRYFVAHERIRKPDLVPGECSNTRQSTRAPE